MEESFTEDRSLVITSRILQKFDALVPTHITLMPGGEQGWQRPKSANVTNSAAYFMNFGGPPKTGTRQAQALEPYYKVAGCTQPNPQGEYDDETWLCVIF